MSAAPSECLDVYESNSRKSRLWFSAPTLILVALLAGASISAQTPVVTQHNNNARTGAYTAETILTPSNVNSTTFGKLFAYSVDGRIYAQPLYVPNVSISGKGTHNVIFVETEHDSIYAFDADSNGGANSSPLWQITLLDSAHGAGANASTVPNSDVSSSDIVPEIGITVTPVIDTTTNTMYVVGKTKEGTTTTYVQRLHAIDITTGAEKFGGPVVISGSVSGTGNGSSGGTLAFDPKWENPRAGLLLQNGIIYIAWGSHGDNGPWHGWIMSYNAATLAQISVYCTTPSGAGSGIWMSGSGIAGDIVDSVNKPYGRLFISTGNGSFNATTPYTNAMSYGDDIVNLDLTGGKLTVQDSFTPSNQATLNSADEDVSSGGVLLLPDQSSGSYVHLLAQAGKEGKIYLVNRDGMGGFNANTDNVVQEVANQSGGLWSMPAFWNNTLYTWGNGSNLMAFTLSNGLLSTTPTASSTMTSGYPGATPAVSANGTSNGIVWAVRTDAYNSSGPAILYAFSATNVATELYDSTQNTSRDTAGAATKFVVPTIADGKVYLGTATELDIYGLLTTPVAATPVISPGSQTFTSSVSVTITDSTTGATIYYTTDGSTPTTSSTQYTGPITVNTTETITAIASATGYLQSASASQTYSLQNQVASPTFSPAPTSFSSPLSVTISDTTSGAKIYYTTDGSTPTTASSLYSAAITLSATTTLKAIAVVSGMNNSNVASGVYTYTPATAGTGSDFVSGFSSALSYMTFNGSTKLADTRLQLTDGGLSETSSAWFNTPLNIQSFTNDFTFQIANPQADGFTFAIQNAGLNALGSGGGGLGYGVQPDGTGASIPNSVAIKFDIYDNAGEGPNSTGLYTNGASPTLPAVNLTGTGIDLHSGDTFSVHMVYNGTTLTMTITDGVTAASYTTSWTVNIPQVVGGNGAYVGFTAGAGGMSSSQKIETWTFTPTGSSAPSAANPTFSLAAGTYLGTQTVSLSDTTSGATIFYTTDGTTPSTTAGGSTIQYSSPISVAASETIRAIATATSYSPSAVVSAAYTIQNQVAAPTFSPGGGTYSSSQTVTISSATSGATIYYTLDGSTPNTTAGGSTLLYSSAITIGATTTVNAIATKSGYTASTVSTAAYTITGSSAAINFSSGFAAGGMIFNGSAALSGTRLRVTNGGQSEAGTAWYGTPVNISSFNTSFTFQITPGTNPLADGFTFIIQSNGTTALGPGGGGLGYGPYYAGGPVSTSILNSVAVKFDLYSNSGETPDSTGLYTNGASPTTPYVDMTPSGVNIHNPDVFNVQITYDGTNLTMTITDTVTAATFTHTWPVNIPSAVGGSTAYVGFGGGSGGDTAIQDIIGWTFTPGSTTATAATPTFSPAAGTYTSAQSVTISDATSGATIYYTTDGSTPTTSSTKYTAAISASSTETLNAIAVASGYNNSAVGSAAYTIQLPAATPTFSPAAGTYTSAQTVTISDTTTGAVIHYTTDGSTPTSSSPVYSSPVSITANATLNAIATAPGFSTSSVGTATYAIQLPTAATPTFSPAAGTYASAQSVTISDATSGATIYYTTDGSTPTTSSNKYAGAISVSSSETVNAIAVVSGYNNSPAGTATYTIQTAAATPTFSPAAGTYSSIQSVTISDTTSGATIYYTTDGSTPTTSSIKYTGAISVSSTETINAIAVASGFNNSAVGTAAYTIQLPAAATPTFSPAAGTYTSAQSVALSDTTTGAAIYYTTNGSTPTTSSTLYSAPITVSSTTTIKAIAVASGYSNSSIASAAFTIQPPAATPTFSPAAGTYSSAQSVTISDTTSGATIYYTTNGSTPTTSSSVYSNPISVSSTTTINAIAVASGFNNSAVATAAYTIQLPTAAAPTFSPAAGTYSSAQSVTLSDTTSGASIYYTTDGSAPTASSTKYTAAIAVSSTTTINAIAVASGYTNSSVSSATYTIQLPAATPTFSPAGGTYSSVQSVIISDTTSGAAIYYTTDGSTPTTSSTKYTAPVSVSSSMTLSAIAVATGFTNSAVGNATYTIQLPAAAAPTFSPAAGTYTSAQSVTLSDTTSGATIYYTTDGSIPTTSSAKYTAAISVSANTTINAMAAASGFSNSVVASATYTIQFPAATPTFSPAPGTYTSAQSVTLSDTTSGATIYYTTDGSTPTASSTKYAGAISVSSTTTLKAIATASGFSTSAVASATYTIQLPPAATPTFSPAPGTYTSVQSVTISDTTSGATIYYTTDGSTPSTSSTKYTAAISVSASETINAIAVASGFSNSTVGSAAYTIQLPAATPTFTPASGTYSTAQSVTISDTTSGATIYYTTDGSTPTTSSTKYTGAISVSASATLKAIATASGFSTSAVASATYTIGTSSGVAFGSGFSTSTGLQFNGGAALSGTRLRITDGGTSEARSAYWNTLVNVQSFTTDFTFQQTGGDADGMTFVLQNSGLTAVGTGGGGLGYGTIGSTIAKITNSIAVKFDLYSNAGEGTDSTGLYSNGASPTVPAVDMTNSGVKLLSGDIMRAHMTYNGTTLVLTVSDTVTGASFTTSWTVNIPSVIGSNTAYAGFTGGTGGDTSTQDVIAWTFYSGTPNTVITDATTGLTESTSGAMLTTLSYAGFPDGTGTILNATGTSQSVTFSVNIPQAGTYDIAYTTENASNRGVAQFSINGTNVGPATNQYASANSYNRFDLGNFTFSAAGTYSFTFTITGKSASSSGYTFAFDDLILTPQ